MGESGHSARQFAAEAAAAFNNFVIPNPHLSFFEMLSPENRRAVDEDQIGRVPLALDIDGLSLLFTKLSHINFWVLA